MNDRVIFKSLTKYPLNVHEFVVSLICNHASKQIDDHYLFEVHPLLHKYLTRHRRKRMGVKKKVREVK